MKWYKRIYTWTIIISVLALLILLVLLYIADFPFPEFLKSNLFWTILGILTATFVSLYTHNIVLKRNKKAITIEALSSIRSKYPNLSSVATAGCQDEDELKKLRTSYLNELEYFSIGIFENVFDVEITAKMSAHLLVKQYESYMMDFISNRRNHDWAYTEYPRLIEILKKNCD